MNALISLHVRFDSPHDVLVRLLDTRPKENGHIPLESRVLRMKPGECHELAVSQGFSLCVLDAGAPIPIDQPKAT